MKLVYEEALRALESQRANLDGLRNRAGTLVAASALVTTFLGGYAVASTKAGSLTFIAIGCFVLLMADCVVILWPWPMIYERRPSVLLSGYVEADPPDTIDQMRRDLALYLEKDYDANRVRLGKLYDLYSGGLALLLGQVMAWLMQIIIGTPKS